MRSFGTSGPATAGMAASSKRHLRHEKNSYAPTNSQTPSSRYTPGFGGRPGGAVRHIEPEGEAAPCGRDAMAASSIGGPPFAKNSNAPTHPASTA